MYDKVYRLKQVKTPEGKYIYYYYDGFGRQSARTTIDAGAVNMTYDANNNLIYSQDANQHAISALLNTYRNYDAINRLTVIGLITFPSNYIGNDNYFSDSTNALPDVLSSTDSILIVNVYDSLNTAVVSLFSSPPSGYTGANHTRGNLVATAYRTNLGDPWNYKYYRYDERGRVINMWNYINGLGWKNLFYYYNSQNQVISTNYEGGLYDMKAFQYQYDLQGRLNFVNLYSGTLSNPPSEEDDSYSSTGWNGIRKYRYNENSQVFIDSSMISAITLGYAYNKRNWIYTMTGPSIFHYALLYNPNGTIRNQYLNGSYVNNFYYAYDVWFKHTYDNSNRLVKDTLISSGFTSNAYTVVNAYDGDGNFRSLKRFDSQNNPVDTFNYTYNTSSGNATNTLNRVHGRTAQFTYDLNGNETTDSLNHSYSFRYDYRNLLTQFKIWRFESGDLGHGSNFATYFVNYYYDEAGNRVNKRIYKWHELTPAPIDSVATEDNPGLWALQSSVTYVRDLRGKEIAIYSDTTLSQWNVFGLDNIGKIDNQNHQYYYLKDHLGNVRVVIDTTNNVVFAQDVDSWGYPLEGRTYDATSSFSTNSQLYKFTSKERDAESSLDGVNGYDYFGARYYNSRIANWTSIDPMMDKQVDYSPYAYVLRDPIILFDPTGKQVKVTGSFSDINTFMDWLNQKSNNVLQIYYSNGQLQTNRQNADGMTDEQKKMFDIITGPDPVSIDLTDKHTFPWVVGSWSNPHRISIKDVVGYEFVGKESEQKGGFSTKETAWFELYEAWVTVNTPYNDHSSAHERTQKDLNIYYDPKELDQPMGSMVGNGNFHYVGIQDPSDVNNYFIFYIFDAQNQKVVKYFDEPIQMTNQDLISLMKGQ